MISQILLGFESLAAILAGESRRCRVSLEVTAQKSFDEEALAAVQTCVIVRGGLLVVLQRLQIRERRFASRATVILFRGLLLLDGVDILMAAKVRQGAEHLAAYVASVLRALVAARVLQELL